MATEGANSLERMLRVIDVVEDAHGGIRFEQLHAALRLTRSTLYRYLKVLSDSGFLTSLPEFGYTLGPRVAELDYKVRTRDPLIIAARPVMAELVRTQPGIALLCRRYGDKVLCVHQERGTDAFHSNYERGKARPLLRGAASRIILACLPSAILSRLYQGRAKAFKEAGLGDSLAAVKANLKTIRQTGWDSTHSQVTAGVTGIAAPVFDDRGAVIGSLSLTIGRSGIEAAEIRRIAERVTFCAGIVSKAISRRDGSS
jgi:DNA-binding IclR family transcriptional regulator